MPTLPMEYPLPLDPGKESAELPLATDMQMMLDHLRKILAANQAAHDAIMAHEAKQQPRDLHQMCNPPRYPVWREVNRKRLAIAAAMRCQWAAMHMSGNVRYLEFFGRSAGVLWSLGWMVVGATLYSLHVVNAVRLREECRKVSEFCG